MLPKGRAVVRGLESGDWRPAQKPPTNSLSQGLLTAGSDLRWELFRRALGG